jgi:hypothetical protein
MVTRAMQSNVCEGACVRLLARATECGINRDLDNHINSLINSCQAGHTVTYLPLAQKKTKNSGRCC